MPGKREDGFEDHLEALQRIVDELEGGECTLEESLERYLDGVKRVKACRDVLGEVERKVHVLQRDADGNPAEAPFTEEADED